MIDEKIKAEAERRYNRVVSEEFKEIIADEDSLSKAAFIAGANFGKEMRGSDITCPFCNDDGFDKLGLKIHLFNHCEEYRK